MKTLIIPKYFTLLDLKIHGVYFLFKADQLIYIGQTTDLNARLLDHRRYKRFDKIRLIQCDKSKMLEYEKRLIAFFKPSHNVVNNTVKKTWERIAPLVVEPKVKKIKPPIIKIPKPIKLKLPPPPKIPKPKPMPLSKPVKPPMSDREFNTLVLNGLERMHGV